MKITKEGDDVYIEINGEEIKRVMVRRLGIAVLLKNGKCISIEAGVEYGNFISCGDEWIDKYFREVDETGISKEL